MATHQVVKSSSVSRYFTEALTWTQSNKHWSIQCLNVTTQFGLQTIQCMQADQLINVWFRQYALPFLIMTFFSNPTCTLPPWIINFNYHHTFQKFVFQILQIQWEHLEWKQTGTFSYEYKIKKNKLQTSHKLSCSSII